MLPNKKTKQVKPSENKAISVALRFIKSRPRSSWEVVKRLQKAGYLSLEINSVIEQLTKVDVLNDGRFAKDWVRWRDRTRPSGAYLLKQELKEKGLEMDLIDCTMELRESSEWRADIGLSDNERSIDYLLAESLVAKKWPKLVHLEKNRRMSRLLNLLARRGFSSSIASGIIIAREKN